jgi:hypothetical protein
LKHEGGPWSRMFTKDSFNNISVTDKLLRASSKSLYDRTDLFSKFSDMQMSDRFTKLSFSFFYIFYTYLFLFFFFLSLILLFCFFFLSIFIFYNYVSFIF